MSHEDLLKKVRPSGLFTSEEILDAQELAMEAKYPSQTRGRGLVSRLDKIIVTECQLPQFDELNDSDFE